MREEKRKRGVSNGRGAKDGRAGVVVAADAAERLSVVVAASASASRRWFFFLYPRSLSFPPFFSFTHSLFARMPAVTVVPLLPPQPTSMTLLF